MKLTQIPLPNCIDFTREAADTIARWIEREVISKQASIYLLKHIEKLARIISRSVDDNGFTELRTAVMLRHAGIDADLLRDLGRGEMQYGNLITQAGLCA